MTALALVSRVQNGGYGYDSGKRLLANLKARVRMQKQY